METVHMLAYPRSGNNWVTYCLEEMASIKTIGCSPDYTCPCTRRKHRKDIIVARSHGHRQHELDTIAASNAGLILLLRNYKECIVRHTGSETLDPVRQQMQDAAPVADNTDYIHILRFYDEYEGPRLLIYYEDLITNPRPELEKLLRFVGSFEDRTLDKFMDDWQKNQARSIKNYSSISYSATKGDAKTLRFHSSKFSREELSELDNWVEQEHPGLFDRYLSRYREIDKDVSVSQSQA